MSKMTRRQKIDASREARLWATTIIGPIVGAVTTYAITHPDTVGKAKDVVVDKFHDIKDKTREKWNEFKAERELKKEIENE